MRSRASRRGAHACNTHHELGAALLGVAADAAGVLRLRGWIAGVSRAERGTRGRSGGGERAAPLRSRGRRRSL